MPALTARPVYASKARRSITLGINRNRDGAGESAAAVPGVQGEEIVGIKTLQDIEDRCRIDGETGCWHWTGAMSVGAGGRTPHVQVGAGVICDKKTSTTAIRVAWLLSGRRLRNGQIVWRTCLCDDCCNPDHMKAGSRVERGKWQQENGYLRGCPFRSSASKRHAARRVVPKEKIELIFELVRANKSQSEISAAVGLHRATVSRIRNGKHVSQFQPLASNASVFNWRPAA